MLTTFSFEAILITFCAPDTRRPPGGRRVPLRPPGGRRASLRPPGGRRALFGRPLFGPPEADGVLFLIFFSISTYAFRIWYKIGSTFEKKSRVTQVRPLIVEVKAYVLLDYIAVDLDYKDADSLT